MDEFKKSTQPKKNKAAAIRYVQGDDAPSVIAKGQGIVADKILEKATEHEIPVYKDAKLADELTKIEIGDYIPPELYTVVAEIMVFVTDLDKLRDKM